MAVVRARLEAGETPLTLWIYAAVSLVSLGVGLTLNGASHPALTIFAVAVGLVFVVLVVRGSRVVWVLFVGSSLFALLSSPFSPRPWWTLAFTVIGLALLLAPPSWRFVWRPGERLITAVKTVLGVDEDAENLASGWYVDPGSPWRMRYWHAEERQWLGRSRTPRKLRKRWDERARERGVS